MRVSVAAEIRSHMGRRNVRQRHLADALGRNQQWLSRRLTGEVAFDIDDLEAIGNVLNVDPVVLMIGAQRESESASGERRDLRRGSSTWSRAHRKQRLAVRRHLEAVRDLAS
jgi:transcriptional regulator with XRE-family HTH domain